MNSTLDGSIWISASDAPVRDEAEDLWKGKAEAEDGTAWFEKTFRNAGEVAEARWRVTGLGVFRVFVGGVEVGAGDLLKPGFTHFAKTRHSYEYDVTALLKTGAGEENRLGAYVSSGWWRDKTVRFHGRRSAFRAVLWLRYADGGEARIATDEGWLAAGVAGPVLRAGIYDGEDYDARIAAPWEAGCGGLAPAIANAEFSGEVFPMEGPPVCLRRDLAMAPVEAYAWKGVAGADGDHFGRVVKTRVFDCGDGGPMALQPGETLVLDFGQNCAAVPAFEFRAARGVTLTARPAEMLNDGDGAKARHCDGPGGSAYVAEYRSARTRARYTFAGSPDGAWERYRPTFTYYGGRYLSLTVEGGPVEIRSARWVPVSSIAAEAETATFECGDAALNRFVGNVLWGQRSNYLSVPTDCPQRAERLGWTADTQVFAKAACYNADVCGFLRKWLHDLRDSRYPDGGYPGVAPPGLIGELNHQFGWGDAGVIVPFVLWRHYGDAGAVRENWEAMARYLALVEEHKFASPDARNHQWADWLSLEKLETASGRAYVGGVKNVPPVKDDALALWQYLGCCHWLWDARMMAEMAAGALGDAAAGAKYRAMADRAHAFIRGRYVSQEDGMLIPLFRDMQTPALFALKLSLLDPAPARATRDALLANIREHGNCLQTGFLGTAMILDVLTENCDAPQEAYSLLLQHGYPSWLYSVDQGATTVWESWDAYTVSHGFSAGMRSFNHYAYGAIFAWLMGTAAGIREDPAEPGWRRFVLAPVPDPRLGRLDATYRSPRGLIASRWRYDGDAWTWDFSIPGGTVATVIAPGEEPREFGPGRHTVARP